VVLDLDRTAAMKAPSRPVRITVGQAQIAGDCLELRPEQSRYLRSVRRLPSGATVEVLVREGGQWTGRLRPDGRALEALEPVFTAASVTGELVLAAGLLRAHRWDWMLEKAVEVGADRIVPLLFERAVARAGSDPDAKVERWQRVVEAAARQSGAPRVPVVEPALAFSSWHRSHRGSDPLLYCDEDSTSSPWPAKLGAERLTLLIGPEGGLSPEERGLLRAGGARAVGLGPRILRAETASIAALVLARALLDGRVVGAATP
jgi:16S rRNA (uracil1498-N3)-methyltransferase